ncbi:hypothetical protein TYRP_011380, partial [Tyrophagus putrescentiae]
SENGQVQKNSTIIPNWHSWLSSSFLIFCAVELPFCHLVLLVLRLFKAILDLLKSELPCAVHKALAQTGQSSR